MVVGAYFEEQVTAFTLEALAEGFDVQLMSDLLVSRYAHLRNNFEFRLFQAGAVPTSLSQALFLWHSVEVDAGMFSLLQQLIDEYDANFSQHLH